MGGGCVLSYLLGVLGVLQVAYPRWGRGEHLLRRHRERGGNFAPISSTPHEKATRVGLCREGRRVQFKLYVLGTEVNVNLLSHATVAVSATRVNMS